MEHRAFQSIRITIYMAVVINGILVQFINPFRYLCDYEADFCIFCGMRTAINLIIAGKFDLAYKSNKLIVLIIIMAVIMILDVIHILYFRIKNTKLTVGYKEFKDKY